MLLYWGQRVRGDLDLFKKCSACSSIDPLERRGKKGPHLVISTIISFSFLDNLMTFKTSDYRYTLCLLVHILRKKESNIKDIY